MTVTTVKAGLIAALTPLKTAGTFRAIVNGEPRTAHNDRLLYLETREGERSHAAGRNVANIYRIAVCAVIPMHANANAEDEIDSFVNLVPSTVEQDVSLGGRVNACVCESWAVDDFVIGENLRRRLTWIFRATEKGSRENI